MGRPKLNISPEALKERKANGATLRKRKQREKQAAEKAAAGQLSTSEIQELIEILLSMPLSESSLFLAKLQLSYKKEYGIEIPGLKEASFARRASDEESHEDFYRRASNARKLSLIRMFAESAIARDKKRKRDEKYMLKEALEAARLKMDVKTYKEHKRSQKKIISKNEEIAATMVRIGKKQTNASAITSSAL